MRTYDSATDMSRSDSYNKGASVEYNSKRDVESLKTFALKALSS